MNSRIFTVLALALVLGPPLIATAGPVEQRLAFSTFVGSIGDEFATGVAVAADGSVYIVGQTDSKTFPSVAALQPANAGGLDAFVAKLSPDGSHIVWSTYFGGSGDDFATGVAVAPDGSAFVTGQTMSLDFPTTPNAFDDDNGRFPTCTGADCIDSFVAKFSPDGQSLGYSTYLGGEHDDYANAIAVDADGHAFITGTTNSFGFPRVNAFDRRSGRARRPSLRR